MNATNRPIDILLNAKSAPLPEAGNREYGSSHSNIKENSFDRVLNEQRREDKKSNQQAQEARRERSPRAEAPRQQQSQDKGDKQARNVSGEDKAIVQKQAKIDAKETDANESGNGLPVGEGDLKTPEDAVAETEAQGDQLIIDIALPKIELEGELQTGIPGQQLPGTGLNQTELVQTLNSPALVSQLKQMAAKGELDTGLENDIKKLTRFLSGKAEMSEALDKGLKLDGLTDKGFALGQELKALLRNIEAPGETINAAKMRITGSNIGAENRNTAITSLLQSLQSTGLAGPGKAGLGAGTIQLPVSSPNWGQAVAQRIAWIASSGVQAAQLQLNPQDLGPVEVRISVANDQTQINFSSQHGAVRDALSQSVDLLRSMLEENGMSMVDVNISDQSLDEGNKSDSDKASEASKTAANNEPKLDAETAQEQTIISSSLIDYYA